MLAPAIEFDHQDKMPERVKRAIGSRVPGAFRCSIMSGWCALPVVGDTYRNCSHGCLYCYEHQSPNQHLRRQTVHPRDHKALFNSIFSDVLVREMVVNMGIAVRIGALSDPFPAMEAWLRNTDRLICLLAAAGIQVQLTTKNPGGIDDGHIEALLQCPKAMVRVSFCTLDDERAKQLEPGAPPPTERLEGMERLHRAGIQVGAKLAPFIHTWEGSFAQATYDAFAGAGCSNVTTDILAFSATWRHTWPPEIWAVVNGSRMPAYTAAEMRNKDSMIRRWSKRQEQRYYAPLQDLDRHHYYSGGYHYIQYDPYKLRAMMLRIRALAHKAEMRWATCSTSDGLQNVDLMDGHDPDNDRPGMCACILPGWAYDPGTLVAAWHKNQWADYIMPTVIEYRANLAMERFMTANDATCRPVALLEKYPSGLTPVSEAAPLEASSAVHNIRGAAREYCPEKAGKNTI